VLNDPEVQIVIELVGGLEPARTFILRALAAGKHVVTANKALLRRPRRRDLREPGRNRCGRLRGRRRPAASADPCVKEGLPANRILSAFGIVNGTCNYILSKMTDEGRDFAEVLKEAQATGYAEADPDARYRGPRLRPQARRS
jgi:homoserine dehydrogenase